MSSYFEHIHRVAAPDFSPVDHDILRAYTRTTGITENILIMNEAAYRIYDVGSERRRWSYFFDNVEALLFCVDISGYDIFSCKNPSMTDMEEARTLFGNLCNERRFQATSIILFFTKIDLLQRKLAAGPINTHFTDFDGDLTSLEDVKAHIAMRFLNLNERLEKKIEVYFDDIVSNPSSGELAFAAIEKCIKNR